MESWMGLYQGCHSYTTSGPRLHAWPDGGALADQPTMVVTMFSIINEMTHLELEQMRNRIS